MKRSSSPLLRVLGFGLLAACGGTSATEGGSEPAGPAGGEASGVSSETPVTEPAATTGGTEVHEWALVDVLEGGTTEVGSGPGHPAPGMAVRKPVVYVHLADGVDELSFSLDARMTSGSILEHWPAGALDGAHVRWDVRARRAHCDTIVPGARDARWGTPADGVTELPDLPSYDAPSAACLTVGDASAGLLFYRGTMGMPSLPLTVTRGADMTATVTATGDTSGAPGEVLRVSTALSGPWPLGHVVVSRVAMPARGETVTLAVGTEAVDVTAEGAHLAEAMLALGLAADEAAAFVHAWSQGLFGDASAAREARSARLPAIAPGPPQDSVIYWLSTPAVDAIATLAIDPPPAAVRRAFLVRVNLGSVSTASLSGPGPRYATR